MNVYNIDEAEVLASRPMPPGANPNTTAKTPPTGAPPNGGAAGNAAGGTGDAFTVGSMIADMIGATCNNVMAPRRGDHWKVSDKESQMLGQAYGAVINKHWPNLKAGPEITAIVVTGMVFGPRLTADKKLRKQSTEQAPENTGSGDAIPGKPPLKAS